MSYDLAAPANFDTKMNVRLATTGRMDTRPLIACGTLAAPPAIASTDLATELSYNWTEIQGNYPKHFTGAHLQNARIPAGANLGMLDGHVEWRNFPQLTPRAGYSGAFFYSRNGSSAWPAYEGRMRGGEPPHPGPLLHKYVEERENTRKLLFHEPALKTGRNFNFWVVLFRMK